MPTTEVFVSVDVETDGPLPGPNSMLSFGAAAFSEDEGPVGTFEANLHTLPEASANPDTARWWLTQPEAWAACRRDPRDPVEAMKAFVSWVKALPGKPVFVAYPAGFDFLFMYTYMLRFAGESPFSFSALDIKSYASAVLGLPFRETVKKNMPKGWFPKHKHNHIALDDATEQGLLFLAIRREAKRRAAQTTDRTSYP
jgi:DNA polymerase III alpha subunit (gram-positive type)